MSSPGDEGRIIKVDYLTRVEGEGALYVRVKDGVVEAAELRIFEPPRFFEAFLRGRDHREAPDITARICGICPVAYQMSAVHAMEDILGVTVAGPLRVLRRLLYCGEWIESHGLHVYMLHAPDFLGYPDALQMAKDHPDVVRDALTLKKAGNTLVTVLGGREIHPINVRVGGFYRAPSAEELRAILPDLERGREIALATVSWSAGLEFPDLERDYEFVSLRHPDEYPMNEGRVVSSRGLDIDVADYEEWFEEVHVPYTHALQSRIKGRGSYLAGPLARYNLNFDKLRPAAQEAARAVGLGSECRNPFKSIVVRAVELVHAFDEAIEIIEGYQRPPQSAIETPVRAGTGRAATEAPRGLLYHRYSIDDEGSITAAKIVPPTSQNQSCIEEDLKEVVAARLDLDQAALTHACEQAIRNYDPCISCATHFLRLELDRS